MALDKQRILSELGSVMYQLQGADCGCMGKLFSNPSQSGQVVGNSSNILPTCSGCRHGCCHGHGIEHSYGSSYNTSPNAGDSNTPMNQHCINPPKLFADTYGYLNQNLMQPVVREVYNDLKSITPENTILNNSLANQMGHENIEHMSQNQVPVRAMNYNNPKHEYQNMNNSYPNQQMRQTGGMGPQILNMMLGEDSSNYKNMTGQSIQKTAAQAPEGFTSLNAANTNHAQYHSGMALSSMGQENAGMQQPNIRSMNNGGPESNRNVEMNQMAQNNIIKASKQMSNINRNLDNTHQMAVKHEPYGQHFHGVTKFKEMFPGSMQGLAGDLNFDPMAVAIQMNPDNKQHGAMDAMKNMFAGNATSTVSNTRPPSSNQAQQNIPGGNRQPDQETINPACQATPSEEHYALGAIANQQNQILNQQVYSVVTENETINKLQPQYQPIQYQAQCQQPGAFVTPPTLPTLYEGTMNSNVEMQHLSPYSPVHKTIKEPLFPVDTKKNRDNSIKQCEYNTLGQPVEMFPARMYHVPEPNLPQTLAPQVTPNRLKNDSGKYSNVKTTISKTSLMGNLPLGKTLSRTQLQQIYNQYKGSQSYTQQNIRSAGHGGTQSEGQLKISQDNVNQPRQAPVEKIGGDTTVNNQMALNYNDIENKVEHIIGHIGDVTNAKSHGDVTPEMVVPSKHSKCRNGLQDMIYTSSPSSAAWSFHGNIRAPLSSAYRFRNKS